MTCATVTLVSDFLGPADPVEKAHRLPMDLATETIHDMIDSADKLMDSILAGEPVEEQDKIKAVARSQFETYLDLMAKAATLSLAQDP